MRMAVVECVVLALKNNLDLKSSFLDRVTQRFTLKVAERMFLPRNFLASVGALRSATYPGTYGVNTTRNTDGAQSGSLTGTWAIPTGGSFNFNWAHQANRPDVSQNVVYSGNWSIAFAQPLLRGAGIEVATAPLKEARLAELDNVSLLKDTIISTITTALSLYRAYLSADRQVAIARTSLESSKSTYETNKMLIQAGRMAQSELVQAEYDIASQEASVESAILALDQARLSLIQFLNLDPSVQFEGEEEKAPTIEIPGLDKALSIAFKNRNDYDREQRAIQVANLNYKVAKNGMLWDFSLSAGTGRTSIPSYRAGEAWDSPASMGKDDWNMGLTLNIPLWNLSYEQTYVTAKIALEKEKINLKKLEMTVQVDVKNNLHTVDSAYKQWVLQQRALELARKRYETEQEKLAVGRSTNFELLTFKNGLATSQVSELTARIAYLNALNALDNSLGTTLDSWGIMVNTASDAAPPPAEKPKLPGYR
jgi:outer membrane protein TolC